MNQYSAIVDVYAREILDSRGNPTVEVEVLTEDGTLGRAAVPSGASTGEHEAVELRDGAARYHGKGVQKAVSHVNSILADALIGENVFDQLAIDQRLRKEDGSENKSRLGANAILGVSMAAARTAAKTLKIPLFRYLGGMCARRLPVPMYNVINGGCHSRNKLDFQEFMFMPMGASCFSDGLRMGAEIYHCLKELLDHDGLNVAVGDEGGFAPDLASDEAAIEVILEAIEAAGYTTDTVRIALDAASSEWAEVDGYRLPKRGTRYSSAQMIGYWEKLCEKYPIRSVEDPLGEEDFPAWTTLTERIGNRTMLVGDDLFVTNPARIREGIERRAANALLVKPNQIGTLTETLTAIGLARDNGMKTILSHRSGETEDTTIADIAVAVNAGFIKSGAPCRSDRTAKYNRLLRIALENDLDEQYGEN